MRVLTLTQPWATLVAVGAKRIETRSWATSYRGPLAIHAGAGLGPVGGRRGLFRQCYQEVFRVALEPAMTRTREIAGVAVPHVNPDFLPRGAIIAVAELMDCQQMDPRARAYALHNGRQVKVWDLTNQERAFGDYSPGRYAWLLADVRPLREPVPCRGAQGLRSLPDDVAAAVVAQLEQAAP